MPAVGTGISPGFPIATQFSRETNYRRGVGRGGGRTVTKARARSRFRAPQQTETRTGRSVQRELVQAELPDPSAV